MGPVPREEAAPNAMVPVPVPVPDLNAPRLRAARRPRGAGRALVLAFALGLAAWAAIPGGPLAAGEAAAQTMADAQRAIEVTQAVIERATLATGCAPGETRLACAYLAQAISLQQSARASYAGGFYRDAVALTLRARDRAYSALRTGEDVTGGAFVRLSIERTDALIERIAAVVRESASEPARRNLDLAVELQRKAKGLAEAGRPRAALAATAQARDRAFRALRLADGGAGATPDRARGALERTDDLLRASAWVAEVGPARAAFEQARAMQERAWDRFRAGQAARALQLSLSARDQLGRALERADRDGPASPGR
jgi:hypothetical protein